MTRASRGENNLGGGLSKAFGKRVANRASTRGSVLIEGGVSVSEERCPRGGHPGERSRLQGPERLRGLSEQGEINGESRRREEGLKRLS